jgi:superfamily II DNA helicase RecQ
MYVYLLTSINKSPEVLLNNAMFRRMFFDRQFQSKLVLTVVDEAHMIYVWGLVASGLGKKISSHFKLQDRGIFRPSYGDLGARLLATHGIPILLLSATCRPIAIKKILESLKILPQNMTRVQGELTRPEIRLIRVTMKSSLGSCHDLKRLFSTRSEIPNNKIPPTLIYAPTRNLTWQVLRVIHESREIQCGHLDAGSTFARRYHSCTGNLDKIDIINGFENEEFPVISCTMALGLGQNWKRVKCVVHVGRGNPSSICQMIGRCGRGENNPGLGIMLVEPNRRTGKNKISDFGGQPSQQSDDDWMNAFAITPVCLRIAMSLDSL